MRIKVWNAFASNNSGSYTIVGSFDSPEIAATTAAELASVMKAHEQWLLDHEGKPATTPSPLALLAEKYGITGQEDAGQRDDWPQYSANNVPQAFAIERKVIIHHEYTVTLPRLFGYLFYILGGRVDQELNHAHNHILALFELWIPWDQRDKIDIKQAIAETVRELNAKDGPLSTEIVKDYFEPAWQADERFGYPNLTIGAAFSDLLAGFTAVEKIAEKNHMRTLVKVFEAYDNKDPFTFLRPSSPSIEV